jgi:hypothetical protein
MFYFVVQHLRWLARVPGLPQYFDALLVMFTLAFRPSRMRAMEELEGQVLQIQSVRSKNHRLGGIEFVENDGVELGHLHGHGLLDVAIGGKAADSLLRQGSVLPHHVFPKSKWVSFQLESSEDVPFALRLVKMAQARNSSRARKQNQAPST